MRDSMTNTSRRIVIPLAAAFVASALGASVAVAQDEPAYAGLDKDLSGTTIKMAAIGGGNYEAMYDSISKFEEETGATVEIVFLGDGFEIDRYLKTELRGRHRRLRRGLEPHQLHVAVHQLRGAAPGLLHA